VAETANYFSAGVVSRVNGAVKIGFATLIAALTRTHRSFDNHKKLLQPFMGVAAGLLQYF
jgi:hypothetical protein